MTNGWQNVFDSFYTRFVLRDFLGKVVPGGILLFAIAVSAGSPIAVIKYVASMSFWAWIAALGGSWLIAFAIQSFGEKPLPRCNFSFIRYYPRSLDQQTFYAKYIRFRQNASPDEKQQVERLVVIKEACGNGYVAIAISWIYTAVDTFLLEPASADLSVMVPLLVVAAATAGYLCQIHFVHVQRQYDYMVEALKLHESKSAPSSK